MLIDLPEILFPSKTQVALANCERDTQKEDGDLDELVMAKIVALAYLQKNWPEGLVFVSRFTKRIAAIPLHGNHWISSSCASEPDTIHCTLDYRYPAESGEGLIHEASHLALYRLEGISSLQLSKERMYRHPWKPDLREARGALLAAHAFLNISEWYLRLAVITSEQQFVNEAEKTLEGVDGVLSQLRFGQNLSQLGIIISSILSERFLQLEGKELQWRSN